MSAFVGAHCAAEAHTIEKRAREKEGGAPSSQRLSQRCLENHLFLGSSGRRASGTRKTTFSRRTSRCSRSNCRYRRSSTLTGCPPSCTNTVYSTKLVGNLTTSCLVIDTARRLSCGGSVSGPKVTHLRPRFLGERLSSPGLLLAVALVNVNVLPISVVVKCPPPWGRRMEHGRGAAGELLRFLVRSRPPLSTTGGGGGCLGSKLGCIGSGVRGGGIWPYSLPSALIPELPGRKEALLGISSANSLHYSRGRHVARRESVLPLLANNSFASDSLLATMKKHRFDDDAPQGTTTRRCTLFL